ncbi:MAG: adenosylmethionine--8-amino-7-oxononanoate transaminase [Myxococcota bacterium]
MTDYAASDQRAVWHPFTQMSDWLDGQPIVIERGEGNYLIDVEGNRYLDGISSMWVNLHGHDHPRIRQAVHEQLDRLAHSTLLGLASVPAIRVAERLVQIAPPGLTRVFFSDNGSTAVEIAIKMAFQYWQQHEEPALRRKTRFVALQAAYHGDTIGAISIGGIDAFHRAFGALCFPVHRATNPHCYRCPHGLEYPQCNIHCLESMESILDSHAEEIAAIVVEPVIQAAAGMIPLPDGWLRRVRDLCDRHNVLLIADEVATGFGRTGRMFGCEHEGVSPDLMALAKGMTAGFLPLAATLATERIFEGFFGAVEAGRQLFHGHSYTGNALGCAATLANLDVFEEENVLQRVQARAVRLRERLEAVRKLPSVGDIRQRGLMVGVELVRDRASRKPFDAADRIGHLVCMAIRKRGIILRPLGDVVVLMPPLSVTEDEIDRLASALGDSIVEVAGG